MRYTSYLLLVLLLMLTASCGGGGSSFTNVGNTTVTTTKISGVASKGIFKPGVTVNVYRINADGTRGVFLATTQVVADGKYNADLGTYTGPAIVEIPAGSGYTDEATGSGLFLSTPLRAVVADVSQVKNISVTPLTEIAAQIAERKSGGLSIANIVTADNLVNSLFKLDILANWPVGFDISSLNNAPTQAVKDYTLALAAISQMAVTSDVPQVINRISSDISGGTMSTAVSQSFTSALSTIMSKTSILSSTTQNLWSVGTGKALLHLAVSGTASPIGGINLTISVPAGISIPTDSDYSVTNSYVTASGSASGTTTLVASFRPGTGTNPGTLTIAVAGSYINGKLSGFNAGEIALINYDLAAGMSPPAISKFTVTDLAAYDTNPSLNPLTLTATLQ